jgi:hypothetical protein
MNRRRFIQAVLGAPVLTRLWLPSQKADASCEIYLISDRPQSHIGPLLETLQNFRTSPRRTFAFINSHPRQKDLKSLLIQKGWSPAAHPTQSDLTLSFLHLRHKASPSFSLVKNGKIWDIRKPKFQSLWHSMTSSGMTASLLTVASFNSQTRFTKEGHSVFLYKDGSLFDRLPLKGRLTRQIPTEKGPIVVRIHEGRAWIAESPCRHKICVSAPPVSTAGERIICAPNHFFLEIHGRGIDTIIG